MHSLVRYWKQSWASSREANVSGISGWTPARFWFSKLRKTVGGSLASYVEVSPCQCSLNFLKDQDIDTHLRPTRDECVEEKFEASQVYVGD